MNEEGRPIRAAHRTSAKKSGSRIGHRDDLEPDGAPDIDARAGGVLRVTTSRRTAGRCLACDIPMDNAGGARSHAAGSGHVVEIDYRTTFLFVGPVSP